MHVRSFGNVVVRFLFLVLLYTVYVVWWAVVVPARCCRWLLLLRTFFLSLFAEFVYDINSVIYRRTRNYTQLFHIYQSVFRMISTAQFCPRCSGNRSHCNHCIYTNTIFTSTWFVTHSLCLLLLLLLRSSTSPIWVGFILWIHTICRCEKNMS